LLPYRVHYAPYTASHVVFYLQLLLFSGLAFFLMLGWLKRTLTITLDVDWLYRCLGVMLARRLAQWLDAAWSATAAAATRGASGIAGMVQHYHGPDGVMARTWPTGIMAFWTTVMLTAYLILSYL
jgi:multicomponent Na+:H+ antiporter subunit D